MDESIRTEIQSEIQAAVHSSQTNILNSITTVINNRLDDFRESFRTTQKDIADSQMAKIDETLSDNYKFKKRGNEEQHKHSTRFS